MGKPILCMATPRACSTVFERVFMTRSDLVCLHEPFGDAFYYGPERLGSRYESDEQAKKDSGFEDSTYQTIFNRIEKEGVESKRLFIKDMVYYYSPPDGKAPQIAPSLDAKRRGVGTTNGFHKGDATQTPPFPYGTDAEEGNPTVIPKALLEQFHITFLTRDPHYSIPSFYRYTVPPLSDISGWHTYDPTEAGYQEMRRIFDFFRTSGQIGPKIAGQNAQGQNGHHTNETTNQADICLIDADDLLDSPEGIIKEYCRTVGLDYNPAMLTWKTEEEHNFAANAFEKWPGWHDDAIHSKDLKPRAHVCNQYSPYLWKYILTAPTEEKAQDRRRMGCGMEGEIWRKGSKDYQRDSRSKYGGLFVPQEIFDENLKLRRGSDLHLFENYLIGQSFG